MSAASDARAHRLDAAHAAACVALTKAELHSVCVLLRLHRKPNNELLRRLARSATYAVARDRPHAVPALDAVIALAFELDAEPYVRSIITRERERVMVRDSGAAPEPPEVPAVTCSTRKPGYDNIGEAQRRLPQRARGMQAFRCELCRKYHLRPVSAS